MYLFLISVESEILWTLFRLFIGRDKADCIFDLTNYPGLIRDSNQIRHFVKNRSVNKIEFTAGTEPRGPKEPTKNVH